MNEELRLIIRNNNDSDCITETIINEFRKFHNNVSGIVLEHGSAKRNRDKKFEYITGSVCFSHSNYEIMTAPQQPIDGDILKDMLPYKSMAMHIMMRTIGFDVFDRNYLENRYYEHLKYWNSILEQNRINCALFMVIPHHCGEYILYSLCKVKGIKTVLLYPILGGGKYVLGSSIEKMGENICKKYKNLELSGRQMHQLSPYFQQIAGNLSSGKVIGQNKKDQMKKCPQKPIYHALTKKLLWMILEYLYMKFIHKESNTDRYKENIKYILKARKYTRKMDNLKDYEKLSLKPIEGEKYIYFPLQVTPEASTMPLAGEFKNQLLSLELLSKSIEGLDLKIYVKEHWVQFNRERGFYKKISSLQGVRLVTLECNSVELIKNSVAVASQTGSCLFEALLKCKPAISIGRGNVFKGAPNIIEASNLDEIRIAACKLITNEINIRKDDVERYLKAIDIETVYLYLDSLDEASIYYNKEDSAKKIVEYVESTETV